MLWKCRGFSHGAVSASKGFTVTYSKPAYSGSKVATIYRRMGKPWVIPHRSIYRLQRRCAPNWNPQNVPNPLVLPSIEFTPLQSVVAQLDSMKKNDEPWSNHGLQTFYEFGEDIGGMEMSRYFGFPKDLYHFDHFMGIFQNKLGKFMNLQSYDVLSTEDMGNGCWRVVVDVIDATGRPGGKYQFTMVKREFGRLKDCWLTKQIVQLL